MQELKSALLKDKQNPKEKSKNFNKSKSDSMWMIEDEPDEVSEKNHSQKFNNSTYFLENKLMELFKKDKKISQTAFDRIIEEFQQQIGEGKNQISYLLVIEDKLTDLTQQFTGQKKKMVEQRISSIRKKQKKNDLLEFDKIVKNNFKKKEKVCDFENDNAGGNFLGIGPIRQRQKSASKSKEKQLHRNESRQKSSQKPLNKLLMKQKHLKKDKWIEEDNINQTHGVEQTEESVSYSAIMSASCAVKQRNRPRRNTKKKDQLQMHQHNKQGDPEQDKEKAFVFYRPKKGK